MHALNLIKKLFKSGPNAASMTKNIRQVKLTPFFLKSIKCINSLFKLHVLVDSFHQL